MFYTSKILIYMPLNGLSQATCSDRASRELLEKAKHLKRKDRAIQHVTQLHVFNSTKANHHGFYSSCARPAAAIGNTNIKRSPISLSANIIKRNQDKTIIDTLYLSPSQKKHQQELKNPQKVLHTKATVSDCHTYHPISRHKESVS